MMSIKHSLGLCMIVAASFSNPLFAEKQAPSVALHSPISTLDSHDAIIANVSIPANKVLPAHHHPGDEFLYLLEGSVELVLENGDTRLMEAGNGYQIPAGEIHTPVGGEQGARAIVFRVHPKGETVTILKESVTD